MQAGAVTGEFLAAVAAGIMIGTVVGAIILRTAIGLYNRIAGGANSPNAVPAPDIGGAMGIIFVTALFNAAAGFIVSYLLGVAAEAVGVFGVVVNVTAQFVSLAVGALIMAGMLANNLPTTFGRAMLVTLLHFLIVIVVGVLVVGLIVLSLVETVTPPFSWLRR